VTNVDRTPRNPNLLVWHDRLWLIDHGAALYRHHDQDAWPSDAARRPFPQIRDHVLLPFAGSVAEAGERLAPRLDEATLEAIVGAVPESWLAPGARRAYVDHLLERLATRAFEREAEEVRRGA
ncbi:MAG: aminotransferase class I and II, partial [Solirubrobacterales bacterium]|nr:aminotransferase class I and II [Solirubrobacterales bacterium]